MNKRELFSPSPQEAHGPDFNTSMRFPGQIGRDRTTPLLANGNTLNANGLAASAPKFWGNSCFIGETISGLTLQNGAQHTIQGAGTIGDPSFSLVNQGSIVANQSARLTIAAASIVNTGQISVTAGNTLGTTYGSFTNAGGTLLNNGGTLTLQGVGGGPAMLSGGNVNVIDGGTLTARTSTALSGVTVAIDSTSNASLYGIVAGGKITNHGTVTLSGAQFANNPVFDNFHRRHDVDPAGRDGDQRSRRHHQCH
jgi:hypothetical protein